MYGGCVLFPYPLFFVIIIIIIQDEPEKGIQTLKASLVKQDLISFHLMSNKNVFN